ncbi:Lrp/AsnC family transcriptional regulator [soil metagenome]
MDDLDRRLLVELQEDARLTMAELGRRIGLSRTATLARVRRLEDDGVISGYHADVAQPASEPSHAARVGIVLRTPDVAAYVRRLCAFDELQEAESVAGEYDLMVRFATGSAARLDAILDRLGGWRETVRTTTFVVLTRYR